jgi:ABC-2 type transport system permease protein
LAPGIVLFGFVMLMFSSAMILSRDRESAFFSRLLTAPVKARDFVAAYSLPYLPVAILQGILLFAIGLFLGLEVSGSVILVILVLLVTSIFYIGLGMVLGSLLPLAPLSGAYAVVLLLTIFGGAWMDLEAIGGVFQSVGNALPFAHALDATRDVMVEGAGFGAIATDFYWVLGYTVVVVALALVFFRRKMTE